MPTKPKGKKIGFLMTSPFNSMIDPFQSPFFSSNPQGPSVPFQQLNPSQNQQQFQVRPQTQQQGGFSLTGLDSMFQNAKTFMGYMDQVRPMVKNLGPMLQMLTGAQAYYQLSQDQKRLIRKAVYKKGKKR